MTKQKRCYEENICGNCKKLMDGDRRGLWKYYCNKKCMNGAMEDFKRGLEELCKGKHGCMVKIGAKKG